MSGGKGGTKTTQVQIPAGLERAAYQNLGLADAVGQLGYVPYTGPVVAGLSDQQRAAMANTNAAASAFGLAAAPTGASNPGGPISANDPASQGYSAYPLYQQAINNIPQGQLNHLAQFCVDPVTGAAPTFANPGDNVPLSRASRGGKK